ncbi:hypothetical protein LY78DRAFT_651779 [Colletotrichum sublineola]|nr:hypothetical protein LY78DRAFT_651779 [Colletotrichum sublineola]
MTSPRNTDTGGDKLRLCAEPDAASRCMGWSDAEKGLQSQSESGLGFNLAPTAGGGSCLSGNQDWAWPLTLLYAPLIG